MSGKDKKIKEAIKKETGYVTSFDGTQIYYETFGEGEALIANNGVGCTRHYWNYFVDYFSPSCKVVLWDYRSHGKSGPAPDLNDLTMNNNARDLKSVLDHLNIEKGVFLGHSMGVQVILEFYSLFPERVTGLIPVLGPYRKALDTFLNTSLFAHLLPVIHYVTFKAPWLVKIMNNMLIKSPIAEPGARFFGLINWQLCPTEQLNYYVEHLSVLDPRVLIGMLKHLQNHDMTYILPDINVPTLIISGETDLFSPLHTGEEMYDKIPDAELLIIPKGTHVGLVEQPELMNLRIEKFLFERLNWDLRGK